jgi:hypothetical protein
VLGDCDFERCNFADPGLGDPRCHGAVDEPDGKVPKQIDDAGMSPLVPRGRELTE